MNQIMFMNLIAYLISLPFTLLIIAVNRTLRISIENPSHTKLFDEQNFIFAIWHENTFTPFYLYRNRSIAMFVSSNLNGKILGYTARHLGYDPIALQDQSKATVLMCKRIRQGQNSIMAVDGPSGPARVIKEGVHYLTEKTSIPTIAVGLHYHRACSINTRWDNYKIPLPFSKVTLRFSKPFTDNKQWEELANELG